MAFWNTRRSDSSSYTSYSDIAITDNHTPSGKSIGTGFEHPRRTEGTEILFLFSLPAGFLDRCRFFQRHLDHWAALLWPGFGSDDPCKYITDVKQFFYILPVAAWVFDERQ